MNGKNNSRADQQVVYVFGRVEQFIEDYARGANLSASELTHRVATLLLAQEGGEILGTQHNLSRLQEASAGRNQSVSEVAMAERASIRAQNSQRVNGLVRSDGYYINAKEAAWLKQKVSEMRASGMAWEQISVELNRSERAIKRAVNYKPPRAYNGTHWMQKPENQARVKREMDKRRKKMQAITKRAKIDGQPGLPRAEWWKRYREARDKMRKGA